MIEKTIERRKHIRHILNKSPVIFCSSLIGKVADISMGGIKMVHTGKPVKKLGKLCKISILGSDFALEFQGKLVGATRINKLMNLCRIELVSLTQEKKAALRRLLQRKAVPITNPSPI